MEWAKLNVFQRLVRQWDALHPYNAAQVVQLAGAPQPGRLTETWQQTLAELGLGRVRRSGRSYRFEGLNGNADLCVVERVERGTSLAKLITTELNRRFNPDDDFPLRPFVLGGDGSHFVGVIYHHWVADSASIRVLLREWFFRLHDPDRARRAPLRAATGGYWRIFGPGQGHWRLDDGLFTSMRWSSRMRRVRRVERCGFESYETHFNFHCLPCGLVDAARSAARDASATLNDVFLAAVAEVCNLHAPVRRGARRQDLALGTIVDLRARRDNDLSDVFGLFLGFSSVVCRPRDLWDWDALLRRIAEQNRLHKRSGVPEASMLRMAAGLVAHRVLGPSRIKEFYRKRLPLAGGVSNVNLNGSWVEQYHPDPIIDYIRVSPCGPMMPLVFTPTTLGRRLNFGLTCRNSLVLPDAATQMARRFAQRLARFAGVHA